MKVNMVPCLAALAVIPAVTWAFTGNLNANGFCRRHGHGHGSGALFLDGYEPSGGLGGYAYSYNGRRGDRRAPAHPEGLIGARDSLGRRAPANPERVDLLGPARNDEGASRRRYDDRQRGRPSYDPDYGRDSLANSLEAWKAKRVDPDSVREEKEYQRYGGSMVTGSSADRARHVNARYDRDRRVGGRDRLRNHNARHRQQYSMDNDQYADTYSYHDRDRSSVYPASDSKHFYNPTDPSDRRIRTEGPDSMNQNFNGRSAGYYNDGYYREERDYYDDRDYQSRRTTGSGNYRDSYYGGRNGTVTDGYYYGNDRYNDYDRSTRSSNRNNWGWGDDDYSYSYRGGGGRSNLNSGRANRSHRDYYNRFANDRRLGTGDYRVRDEYYRDNTNNYNRGYNAGYGYRDDRDRRSPRRSSYTQDQDNYYKYGYGNEEHFHGASIRPDQHLK